jgi:FkbM family methyltransferase
MCPVRLFFKLLRFACAVKMCLTKTKEVTPISQIFHWTSAIWCDESNRDQRLRALTRGVGWQVWKRTVRRPLNTRLFNGLEFRAYPNCTISSSAFYSRIPYSRSLQFLRGRVDGGTLIDVGANIGLVSMLLADKFDHALLFEPNALAAMRARENIALNGLSYEVHEMALSDQNGAVHFEDLGGAHPCNRTVVGFDTKAPTIKVPRMKLDDFLGKHKPLPSPITAIKIDVEGHENPVLQGMTGVLAQQRPRVVMFEYLQRTDLERTFEIFSRCGYRVMLLTSSGKPALAPPDVPPLQDLFACPEEFALAEAS